MSRRASQTRHEPDKNAVLEISAKDKQGAELIFAPKKKLLARSRKRRA